MRFQLTGIECPECHRPHTVEIMDIGDAEANLNARWLAEASAIVRGEYKPAAAIYEVGTSHQCPRRRKYGRFCGQHSPLQIARRQEARDAELLRNRQRATQNERDYWIHQITTAEMKRELRRRGVKV